MLKEVCFSCRRPKAILNCGICQEYLCKDCALFLSASTFSFRESVPAELKHDYYCSSCHSQHVEPALESYHEIMGRARELFFFFNTQKKSIPVLKRGKETIHVKECVDRDETILRLAFLAAELGYNSVIEAEVVSKKVRNEGYQKSMWSGVGIPAQVDAERLERILHKD